VNNKEIIQRIKSVAAKYPQIELAYLFGSFALGHQRKDSDVDVAVKLSDRLSEGRRFDLGLELIGAFTRAMGRETDVVILNDAKDLFFKYIILKEGILAFRRKDLPQMIFETRVFNEYFDYQPFFDAYNKAYVQRSLQ
jgi:predicted nucleotidyltransferase